MTRPLNALLALAIALTAVALSATPASAGTYTSWSCRTPQGGVAAVGDAQSGWRAYTTGHIGTSATNRCGSDGYMLARLGNYSYPWAAGAGWRFYAPANTQVSAYELHWSGHAGGVRNSTSWVGDVRLWRSDQTDPAYVRRYYGGGAFGSSTPLASANLTTQSGIGVSAFYVEAGCSPGFGPGALECPAAGSGETAMARIYRSKVTLSDSSAPNVGMISGDALEQSELAGNETISVNATDTGSGVYRLILNVDGTDRVAKVINADGGRCADVDPSNANPYEFVQPQPCPLSNSGDVVIDTTSIADGEHTLRLKVEDAAGNRTTAWGPSTRTVDNVPPPAPRDPDGDGPQTGRPTIAGVAKEGNTLVADPGSWSGDDLTFGYAWERCDAGGANCSPIAGADGRERTLAAADIGKRLRVVVTATNPEGSTKAASDATATVLAAGCTSGCAAPSTSPGTTTPGPTGSGGATNGVGASALGRVAASYNGERIIRTKWGKRVVVTGRLLNEHGSPITGAVLDILERPRSGGTFAVRGTVVTASDGTFAYLLPVGASRMLRFAYRHRSDRADYTHSSDVELIVKAKVALRATGRVSGRRPLRFRGKVPGAVRRSFVLLQARVGSRWQIFEKARVRSNRTFRARYVFRRTRVRTTFRFRAIYPGRDASQLEPGRSAVAKVRYTP